MAIAQLIVMLYSYKMTRAQLHQHFSILLVAFLLMLQLSVSAHALEHSNIPHQHDDKICAISLISEEDEFDDVIILPPSILLTTRPPNSIFKYRTLTAHNHSLPIEVNTREPPHP